jgi:hypothetical protein
MQATHQIYHENMSLAKTAGGPQGDKRAIRCREEEDRLQVLYTVCHD